MQAIIKAVTDTLNTRWVQFVAIPVLVLVWFLATDPSNGADTLTRFQLGIAQALVVTGFAYLMGKAMLGKASSEVLYARALEGNTAAGVAYLGVCLMRAMILWSLLSFFSATVAR